MKVVFYVLCHQADGRLSPIVGFPSRKQYVKCWMKEHENEGKIGVMNVKDLCIKKTSIEVK